MNYLMVLLRLVHILGGVFWVGTGLLLFFFVSPSVMATGEAGTKFMGHLVGKSRLMMLTSAAAGSTVLAGAILYWIDSDGFSSTWLSSGPGIGFGLGAVFAIIAFISGIMVGRANTQLAALGREVQGQPTAAQASRLAALRARLGMVGAINAWCLILAAALMGTARYFSF